MGHSSAFMQLFAHLPVSGLLFKRHLAGNRSKPKILLAVDDSEASMTAVRRLPELLRTQDMDVILATVQSPIYQDNALLAPYVNQDILDQALAGNATMIFEMAQEILDTEGIPVQDVKRMIGSPAAELGYLAQVEEPDLLVVGSHNRKGVLSWLMGSVSSQLLHWDTHNILIVR
jgi:nucleotide-binding universal stress UspA family protein